MMRSKVKWVRLGDFIIDCDERNSKGLDLPIIGINRDKDFMPTVANTSELDTTKYKIIREGRFVFSGMQTGRDVCIRLGLYTDKQPSLISPAYTTFTIDESKGLSADFLFMYFYREEMDRYGWFISDSSVRANLDWPRFLDIQIPLPPIEEQRKIVDVWKGLRKVKEDNEKIAEPLLQLCQSYIQELKHSLPLQKIGEYLTERNERNYLDKYGEDDARGVNTQKEIQPCKRIGEKLNTYKIIHPRDIVFNANIKLTQDSEKFAIALFEEDKNCIVTNFYTVFSVDESHLLQEYLMLWLIRDEFARFVKFMSCSSVRDRFDFSELKEVAIPIPSIDTQKAIVSIYKCANEAKRIANEADKQSREICPALMQYVINA